MIERYLIWSLQAVLYKLGFNLREPTIPSY
jgi:hypothetical protein